MLIGPATDGLENAAPSALFPVDFALFFLVYGKRTGGIGVDPPIGLRFFRPRVLKSTTDVSSASMRSALLSRFVIKSSRCVDAAPLFLRSATPGASLSLSFILNPDLLLFLPVRGVRVRVLPVRVVLFVFGLVPHLLCASVEPACVVVHTILFF